jgi:hypothetical protein
MASTLESGEPECANGRDQRALRAHDPPDHPGNTLVQTIYCRSVLLVQHSTISVLTRKRFLHPQVFSRLGVDGMLYGSCQRPHMRCQLMHPSAHKPDFALKTARFNLKRDQPFPNGFRAAIRRVAHNGRTFVIIGAPS